MLGTCRGEQLVRIAILIFLMKSALIEPGLINYINRTTLSSPPCACPITRLSSISSKLSTIR